MDEEGWGGGVYNMTLKFLKRLVSGWIELCGSRLERQYQPWVGRVSAATPTSTGRESGAGCPRSLVNGRICWYQQHPPSEGRQIPGLHASLCWPGAPVSAAWPRWVKDQQLVAQSGSISDRVNLSRSAARVKLGLSSKLISK